MVGVTVVAAESDEEARFLFSSLQQSTLNNRTGRRGRVPPPVADFDAQLDPYARAILADSQACAIVGADRKSTRLNSSHRTTSYAVFCLKKKKHSTLSIAIYIAIVSGTT